jgi:WD40 repeat protein
VRLWDAATGKPRATLEGHDCPVFAVAFHPDGKVLVSGGGEHGKPGEVKVWAATGGKEKYSLGGHQERVKCVAFSADGRRMATASFDRTVRLWHVEGGEKVER